MIIPERAVGAIAGTGLRTISAIDTTTAPVAETTGESQVDTTPALSLKNTRDERGWLVPLVMRTKPVRSCRAGPLT